MSKVAAKVKPAAVFNMIVPAGKATPQPPVGSALGQRGLKLMDFCKAFNDQTGIYKEGLSAVKELLVSKENDPENVGSRPPSPKPDGEESRADKYRNACDDLGEPSFAALGTMFDPNMGGTCTDEKVTAWLAYLLIPEE